MQETKIQLLPFEIELVSDTSFILTKNAILKKIHTILSTLEATQKEIIQNYPNDIPAEVLKVSSKVSKGENYKGLPWLVLDHPRFFEPKNAFAIRTMFWWGNFFSTTLHLSGKYKEQMQKSIFKNVDFLQQEDFYLCLNENEWEHHFETDNYRKANEFSKEVLEEIIYNKPFLKISMKLPIKQMITIEEDLNRNFESLIKLLH